jgi:Lipocalin-like domain
MEVSSNSGAVTGSGDASTRILGVWKLVSFEAEIQATGQKEPVMGQNPTGFAIFTETRALFLLTGKLESQRKRCRNLLTC